MWFKVAFPKNEDPKEQMLKIVKLAIGQGNQTPEGFAIFTRVENGQPNLYFSPVATLCCVHFLRSSWRGVECNDPFTDGSILPRQVYP